MKEKLSYQDCGTAGWAVLIQADNASDIENRFNSFWNHGATSGELHWQSDSRAYFWTNAERLLKAMHNAYTFALMNEMDVADATLEMEKTAAKAAIKTFGEMEKTRDVLRHKTSVDFFELGTIKAENLSDNDA